MGLDIHISVCNENELDLALKTCSVVSCKGDVKIFTDGFTVSNALFCEVVNLPKMRSSLTGDLSWFKSRIIGLDKGVLLLDADTTVFDIPEFPEDAISCPLIGKICTSNVMYIPKQFHERLIEYCDWFAANRRATGLFQDPYLTAAFKRLGIKINDIRNLVSYHMKGGTPKKGDGYFFAHHNHGLSSLNSE